MAYTVVAQGATVEEFQAATPLIDDIPAGTAMRIEFEPPGWTGAYGNYYSLEDLNKAISSGREAPENFNLYLKYWSDVALDNLEGPDTMHVTRIYRDGFKVVIDGTATGFPVLLAVVIIVACISLVVVSGFEYVKNIKISADSVKVAELKAQVSADLTSEIKAAIAAGYSSDEIQAILSGQAAATDAVNPPVTQSTSTVGDITSLIKWGIIGFLAFQALGLFKEVRSSKKAMAETG